MGRSLTCRGRTPAGDRGTPVLTGAATLAASRARGAGREARQVDPPASPEQRAGRGGGRGPFPQSRPDSHPPGPWRGWGAVTFPSWWPSALSPGSPRDPLCPLSSQTSTSQQVRGAEQGDAQKRPRAAPPAAQPSPAREVGVEGGRGWGPPRPRGGGEVGAGEWAPPLAQS